MSQLPSYQTIQISAANCADNYDDHERISITDIDKHGGRGKHL
jgi:hypothetical protein